MRRLWLLVIFISLVRVECVWAQALASTNTTKTIFINLDAVTPARQDDYYVSLLRLVLDASKAPNEEIELNFSDRQFTQWRWMAELTHSGQANNLLWTATSVKRERLLRPIRIPMFKGMIGVRVLVIRREDEQKFQRLSQLQDLQQLIAGQGAGWPDTLILRANGLQVTESVGKEQLYKMLAAKRFDYFPRGVTEIANEARFLTEHNLMVAPGLYLSYPAAMYFFVNKDNEELARRVETGFERIINNGKFDAFFFGHLRIKHGLPYLQGSTPILLENPTLPKTVPINNPRYWYHLADFQSANSP
jgi:hypothetical protein